MSKVAGYALRAAFYGALLGAAIYGQPAARCFYNPFQETNLAGPCLHAVEMALLPAPHRISALLKAASEYQSNGETSRAVEAVERAMTIDPSPATKTYAAGILNDAGNAAIAQKSYDAAIPYFTRALEIDPSNRNALNQRGFAYQNLKQLSAAVADYGAMIKRDASDKSGYLNRANVYLQLGAKPEVVADLSAFIKLGGKETWAWSTRAWTRWELKDYAGAIEDADVTLTFDSKNEWAHTAKVKALTSLARFDEAMAAIDQWEQAAGQKSSVTEGRRAEVFLERGYAKSAVEAFDRAIALDPKEAWVLKSRGYIKWKTFGDTQGALDDFEQASALGDKQAAEYERSILSTRAR